MMNDNEFGISSKERMVEATRGSSETKNTGNKNVGTNIIASTYKITKNEEKESNKSERRRSSRHRIHTESMVDEEVGEESNTSKKPMARKSVSGRKRRTMDSKTSLNEVEQGNDESSVAANTRMRLSQANTGKSNEKKTVLETETSESLKKNSYSSSATAQTENETQLNEDENQEDIFVQLPSQNADSDVNAEGRVVKLLGPAPIKLPFEKASPFWKTIESSEIFLNMPQQPHFIPLKQYVESCREGMAIGLMVTFANTVNKISKFCISNTGESIEEMMDSLVDLERHGFNLYNLQTMLKKLRDLKENHKRVMGKLHTMNDLKSDMQNEEGSLNENLEGIRRSIRELELKEKSLHDVKSSTIERLEAYEEEISKLQSEKEAAEKSFEETRRSLQRVGGRVE